MTIKMNYIGNEAEWVTDDLMNLLTTQQGNPVPIWDPERWHGHPLLDKINALGTAWFGDTIPNQYFYVFNSRTKCMEDYNFELPGIIKKQECILWWFVKLNPGELQLMHYDMHPLGVFHQNNNFSKVTSSSTLVNPKRYTMYLQDWEPGHVFVYDDKMNVNYKKGDIYEWNDPETFHGVVNLSFNPRYTLQITMCDSI
jgi:hypothetical protein